jgi:XapX domain-containing protein
MYSFVSGLLFGIGYGLLGLKSPAPPLIALVGLLGMLGGDQLVTQLKSHLSAREEPPAASAPAAPRAESKSADMPDAGQPAKNAVPQDDKH